MKTGTVKFNNPDKGYGFIKPDDGSTVETWTKRRARPLWISAGGTHKQNVKLL